MQKIQKLLLSSSAVSLLAILPCANAAGAVTFLQPASGQILYVGTQYSFVADLGGAGTATAVDQKGNNLACSVQQGLAVCLDTPTAGSTTWWVKISSGTQNATSPTFTVNSPSGVYPHGDKMLVGSYAGFDAVSPSLVFTNFVATGQNSTQVTDSGSNGTAQAGYVNTAATAGVAFPMASLTDDYCSVALGGNSATLSNCETSVLTHLLSNTSFKAWEIDGPEYYDPNNPGPFNLLEGIYTYVHKNDTRPFFAYIDGGIVGSQAGAPTIQPFVPYVDLVGAGAYEIYANQPPIYVRWQVEQEIDAIKQAGYSIGPNYSVSNQKTPVLINETACYSNVCTAAGGYIHDVFAGLSAGAQGVFTYYYYQSAQTIPGFQGTQGAFPYVTGLINGPAGVGEWALKGTHQSDLQVTINSGPTMTPPLSDTHATEYPSVRAAVFDRAGIRLVIAVNSTASPVTATMAGLPASGLNVQVLGEARTATISTSGAINDSFIPYGVHIYQVPLVTRVGSTWTPSN